MSNYIEGWIHLVDDDYPLPPEDLHIRDIFMVCRGCGNSSREFQERVDEIVGLLHRINDVRAKVMKFTTMESPHWSILYNVTQAFSLIEREVNDILQTKVRVRYDLEEGYRKSGGMDEFLTVESAAEMMEMEVPPDDVKDNILQPDILWDQLDAMERSLQPVLDTLKCLLSDRKSLVASSLKRLSAKLRSDEKQDVLLDLLLLAQTVDQVGSDAVLALAACTYDSPVQLHTEKNQPELNMADSVLPQEIERILDSEETKDDYEYISSHAHALVSKKTRWERQSSLEFLEIFVTHSDTRISQTTRNFAKNSLISARARLHQDSQRNGVATLPDARLVFCPSVANNLLQILRFGTEVIFEAHSMIKIYKDSPNHVPLRKHIESVGSLACHHNELALIYLKNELLPHESWENRQMAASVLCPLIGKSKGPARGVTDLLFRKLFNEDENATVRSTIQNGLVNKLEGGKIHDRHFMEELEHKVAIFMHHQTYREMWRFTKQLATCNEQQYGNHEFSTLIRKRNLIASGKLYSFGQKLSAERSAGGSDCSVRSLRAGYAKPPDRVLPLNPSDASATVASI